MIHIQNLKKLHEPIEKNILKIISRHIDNSDFIGGNEVKKFEESFGSMHKFKSVVACGNGTDALYIALKALNLPKNSDVLVTSLTWISSSEIITQAGHNPIFVDVENDSFNVSLKTIKKSITKETRAIVLVHLYGIPCNLDEISEYCKKNNIRIIEDCAQAHFAKYNHKYVGTYGDVATFSFYPGKNLGALGDAGAIATNNDDIADFCRLYSKHGAFIKHNHLIEGINSRMDSIQAAVLNLKLDFILSWTEKRKLIASEYLNKINNSYLTLPKSLDNSDPVWHLFTIEVENRKNFSQYLKQCGIGHAFNYPVPVPLQPCYKRLGFSEEQIPNSSKKCSRLVNIPMCPTLRDSEIKYIIDSLNAYSI